MRTTAFTVVLVAVLFPSPANGQVTFDAVGARALGMAGAFVAVADDATAGFWNPAGLLDGPMAGLTIGWDQFQFRDLNAPPADRAGRLTSRSVALGAWPVGVSFLRVESAGIRTDAAGVLTASSLRTSQIGFTVLQSLGERAVLGATVKYIRGSAGIVIGPGNIAENAKATLDRATDLAADSEGAMDLDVGLSFGGERLRAAITFKNLLRPAFATIGENSIILERRARFGLAAFPRDGLTLAIDVDLDTADPLVGLRRTIAMGGETRLGARLALRGGIRWELSKAARAIGALGGSIRLRQGLWLDGYVTGSHAGGNRGLGVALRAAPGM